MGPSNKQKGRIPQWFVGILLALCAAAGVGFVARQELIGAKVGALDRSVTTLEADYGHFKEDMMELKAGQNELKRILLERK